MDKLPSRFRPAPVLCSILAAGLFGHGSLFAAPSGGSVVAGNATIGAQGATTTIVQTTERAIINWRDFSTSAGEGVRFVQPGRSAATLNRVTGAQASTLHGRLDANGQVILINPHGVLIGKDARVDVGSLIASTSSLADDDFLAGRLRFTPSGIAGSGIRNAGTITAAEGGLVALVAPHVRNDGVIEARLGRVQIGAADRFTIDLYGDGLINLSLDESNRGNLKDAEGRPVDALISMGGAIRTDGGSTVLIAAADARGVLDRSINLQGIVRADTVSEQGGKIVLSGGGGVVDVSGALVATGKRGGEVDVVGQHVRLQDGTNVDAHGDDAGGRVRIGGDWQGSGDLQRSLTTDVAAGARIDVSADALGSAGQAVVWSDDRTSFAGLIRSRGADAGGDGGQVEVSGKRTLEFSGHVDAGALRGSGGSLLLDPETINIGINEAGSINRILRLGVSTTVTASLDINVNSLVDGRGRASGGGLTLSAGRDINLNNYVVTQNGAVNLSAGGGVTFAPGMGIYSGSGPINVNAVGNIAVGKLYSTGGLTVRSTAGSLSINQPIYSTVGAVSLRALSDLTISQPMAIFQNGNTLFLTSDSGSVLINAQIDGLTSVGGNSGLMAVSAGNGIQINDHLVTQNGAVSLTAGAGGVSSASGKVVFSGLGNIGVLSAGNVSMGHLVTSGQLDVRSTSGSVTVSEAIDGLTGNVALRAAQALTINQPIVNFLNGSSLSLTSDSSNVVVNAQVDGRAANGVSSGPVTVSAGGSILLNQSIISEDSPITLAAGGTVTPAVGKGLFSGNGAISVTTAGSLVTGIYGTTGALALRSTGGTLTVGQGIDGTTGAVSLRSASTLTVSQPIVNILNGSSLNLTSDSGNIVVGAQIDGRDSIGASSGAVTLSAGGSIQLNESIVTENSAITLTATSGTLTAAANKGLFAGSGAISVTTGGALSSGIYGTTGPLGLRSTGGPLTIATKLDETLGNVTLRGGTGVTINQGIANIRNGSSLTVIVDAGNIDVSARIDAQDDATPGSITPVAGGTVTMTAAGNVNVNETIVTYDGAVSVTATSGSVIFSNAGTDGSGNKKIMAGSAPITITTGSNFSTGTAPPSGLIFDSGASAPANADAFFADSLKPWVTMATTGKLTLVSTGGNVTIDAPIPQTTGEVEISAGNNVVVNEKLVNVGTAGKPISITAGTACTVVTCTDMATQGGIFVFDALSEGAKLTYTGLGTPISGWKSNSPEVDSRQANLTMTAFGNIDINEAVASAASAATMTLTSTQGRLLGTVGDSRNVGPNRPANMILSGYAGIGDVDLAGSPFNAGYAGTINATSANGPVYLNVSGPGSLTVTAPSVTAGDIVMYHTTGGLGANSTFTAGRDLDLRNSNLAGSLSGSAGRDVLFRQITAGLINITGAGNDVLFDYTASANEASIWMRGALTVSNVTRDIRFLTDSGVSLIDCCVDNDPKTGAQPAFTLSAGRNVELRRLQTYGAVSISAGDDIRLWNDIGPTITGATYFTEDQGVASLTLTTGTAVDDRIDMLGARAVGAVNITTHTLVATKQITGSPVVINATSQSIGATPIGTMAEMAGPGASAPAIPPGPAVNPPAPPGALNALPPGAPGTQLVAGASSPGTQGVAGTGAPAGVVGSPTVPAGDSDFGELVLVEVERVNNENSEATALGEIVPESGTGSGQVPDNEIAISLDSPLRSADFGRSGPFSGHSAPAEEGKGCARREDGSCA